MVRITMKVDIKRPEKECAHKEQAENVKDVCVEP